MKKLILLITMALISCSSDTYTRSEASIDLGNRFKANAFKYIDFSELGGDKWTKVCFLGPYNVQSSKALGFNWDVTKYTDVLKSDSHNVIIFATDSEVVNYIIHNRGYGDFWQLSGKCFTREKSRLIKGVETGSWHSELQ